MAAPTLEMEPVEPQSLKKLSLKSLKRTFHLFSPIRGQFAAPNPESKKIRMSHKVSSIWFGFLILSMSTRDSIKTHSAIQEIGKKTKEKLEESKPGPGSGYWCGGPTPAEEKWTAKAKKV
ncbi:hypothetical protein GOBAR_DD08971 [Gossypium barbadense]|nr:hypothetical protein GOBAR_DD08971 [Gossypium barbadense]